MIDRDGTVVIRGDFDSRLPFGDDGIALVHYRGDPENLHWFMDKKGNRINSFHHYIDGGTDELVIAVPTKEDLNEDGGRFFVNRKGEVVIPGPFEDAFGFHEGLAQVRWHERWGFVDKTGAMVVLPQFFDADRFSEGVAAVTVATTKGNRKGFIDKTGQFVIPPLYSSVGDFRDGLVKVNIQTDDGAFEGYIDHAGEWVYKQPKEYPPGFP